MGQATHAATQLTSPSRVPHPNSLQERFYWCTDTMILATARASGAPAVQPTVTFLPILGRCRGFLRRGRHPSAPLGHLMCGDRTRSGSRPTSAFTGGTKMTATFGRRLVRRCRFTESAGQTGSVSLGGTWRGRRSRTIGTRRPVGSSRWRLSCSGGARVATRSPASVGSGQPGRGPHDRSRSCPHAGRGEIVDDVGR